MSDILKNYSILAKLVPVTNLGIYELFYLGLSQSRKGFWQQYFV